MNTIKTDIFYLSENLHNLSLDQTCEYVQKKDYYKILYKGGKNQSLYAEYKKNIVHLRSNKLPFRIVDIAKNAVKSMTKCPDAIRNDVPSSLQHPVQNLTKEEFKKLFADFQNIN